MTKTAPINKVRKIFFVFYMNEEKGTKINKKVLFIFTQRHLQTNIFVIPSSLRFHEVNKSRREGWKWNGRKLVFIWWMKWNKTKGMEWNEKIIKFIYIARVAFFLHIFFGANMHFPFNISKSSSKIYTAEMLQRILVVCDFDKFCASKAFTCLKHALTCLWTWFSHDQMKSCAAKVTLATSVLHTHDNEWKNINSISMWSCVKRKMEWEVYILDKTFRLIVFN
jgi:hypothetical protein